MITHPTTRPRWRRLAPLAVLVAVLTAVGGCGKRGEADDGGDADAAAAQPVVGARTVVVGTGPFAETLGAIGSIAARPGHVAALSAPAPARVARVDVTTGQRVSAGQPLVELEQGAFRAAAQSADAGLDAARLAYERAQRLAAEGIAPRKDVEQAAAALARARADAVAARREAQLSVLRSPIPGVVTSLTATLGASVDASQPLVEVTDPTALDAMLNLSPTDAARVRPGAAVTLSAGQGAAGEPLGAGRVASVEAEIDTATRGVLVRVLVPQARRTLRVGETVYGQIAVGTRAAAITVPLEALVPEGDGFKVFVVDASSVAHARAVTVGGRTDQLAEVTGGLAAGERVVAYGAYGVQDGARVVPLQAGQREPPASDSAAAKARE
jgi:RND family efflux transporter MFP subunit